MRKFLAALALVTLSFAGCLDSNDNPSETTEPTEYTWKSPDWAKAALPGIEVDHTDNTYWQDKTTPNFEVVGWDPMVSGYHGTTSGTTLCGGTGTTDDGQVLAATHGFSNDAALMVHDVTDPANPEFIGELILPRTGVYDATLSDDGRWALLAAKAIGDQPDAGPLSKRDLLRLPEVPGVVTAPMWRNACGETFEGPTDLLPYGNGVILVDLSNPVAPTVADFFPSPHAGGVHSVESKIIDGTTWALASGVSGQTGTSFFQFFNIIEPGKLLPTGIHNGVVRENVEGTPQADLDAFATELHTDGLFAKHPITGQPLAYLSDWDGGLLVADLSRGGNIVIGAWKDTQPTTGAEMTGQIHSAAEVSYLIDDRYYVLAGQENLFRPAERPTGQIVMLDMTDPTNPSPVARWTLPVDPGDDGEGNPFWPTAIAYSTHYFQVVNNTLFTSTYHGGVWAADISKEHWPELPTTGVFMPSYTSPNPPTIGAGAYGGLFYLTPMVLEVLALDDGTLVSWDSTSGIYTYRFTENHPDVEPVPAWVDDRWI